MQLSDYKEFGNIFLNRLSEDLSGHTVDVKLDLSDLIICRKILIDEAEVNLKWQPTTVPDVLAFHGEDAVEVLYQMMLSTIKDELNNR